MSHSINGILTPFYFILFGSTFKQIWGNTQDDTHPFSSIANRMHSHRWGKIRSRKFASDLSVVGAVEMVEFAWYDDDSCTVSITRSPFSSNSPLTRISLHMFFTPAEKPCTQLQEPPFAVFTYDYSRCTKCQTELCSCADAVAPTHSDHSNCFVLQTSRPDGSQFEAHYYSKLWQDRQRMVSRGSKKGVISTVLHPFKDSSQRISMRQKYFSIFRDAHAISARIEHQITKLLAKLPMQHPIQDDMVTTVTTAATSCGDGGSASCSASGSGNGDANANLSSGCGTGRNCGVSSGGSGKRNTNVKLSSGYGSSGRGTFGSGIRNATRNVSSGCGPSSGRVGCGAGVESEVNGSGSSHKQRQQQPILREVKDHIPADALVSMVLPATSLAQMGNVTWHSSGKREDTVPKENSIGPRSITPDSVVELPSCANNSNDRNANVAANRNNTGNVVGGVVGSLGSNARGGEMSASTVLTGTISSTSGPEKAAISSSCCPEKAGVDCECTAETMPNPALAQLLNSRCVPLDFGAYPSSSTSAMPNVQHGSNYNGSSSAGIASSKDEKDLVMSMSSAVPRNANASLPLHLTREVPSAFSAVEPQLKRPRPGPASVIMGVTEMKSGDDLGLALSSGPWGSSSNIRTEIKDKEIQYGTWNLPERPLSALGRALGVNPTAQGSVAHQKSLGLGVSMGMPSSKHSLDVTDGKGARADFSNPFDLVPPQMQGSGECAGEGVGKSVGRDANFVAGDDRNALDGEKAQVIRDNHNNSGEGTSTGSVGKVVGGGGVSCEICGISFAKRGNKMRHILTVHQQKKQFQCDLCGARFGLKADLRRHRFRIHESRSFVCATCDKSFAEESQLEMHVRVTHEEDSRPWECKTCHIRFGRKSSLTRHEQTVHQHTRFECRVCKKSYSQRFDAIRHERKVHGLDDKQGGVPLKP